MNATEIPVAKDPIVLDAEGHVLHDPRPGEERKSRGAGPFGGGFSGGKVYTVKSTGILPKILFGLGIAAFLFVGLTVVGVVLATLFVGFLVRLLFFPKARR